MRRCNAGAILSAAAFVGMLGLHRRAAPADEAIIQRHVTLADQQARRYDYVPIDVPPGTTQLTIAYRYDFAGGSNAIDFGLVEPGPLAISSAAFRGWSGGSRDRITVGLDQSTPGYWPGPIPSGRWHAVLGLYKVATGGVDVTLTISFSREPRRTRSELPARSPAVLRSKAGWYVGVTHAHTTDSDGALSAAELIEKARAEQLDFLAITDHNVTTHQLAPLDRPDVLVMTGEEVTTPAGHFNVWGLSGWRDFVDFRMASGHPALSSVMNDARRRGAVVSINHPATDCLACTWTHPIPDAVEGIEIANGTAAGRQQSMAIWDTLLRSCRRVAAVEGRDWHRGADPLGTPALRVWANDLSERSILEGIRRGRAVVVADARLPVPELTVESGGRVARVGDTLAVFPGRAVHVSVATPPPYRGGRLEWVWNGEPIASMPIADGRDTLQFDHSPAASGYARIHLFAADGRPLAVTNPVYIVVH